VQLGNGDTPGRAPVRGGPMDGTVDLARDRDLVERCQGGDRSAFEELYHRYHRRLFHFCLRRLHEPYEAEDAVQESFAKAWRAMPRFGGERRF
jgi:RNA polymerase sigma-70 factor (ECF subfamily)